MGKILTILLLCCTLSATAQEADSLSVLKDWQVKGYAESALRVSDNWQAQQYFEEWYRRQPDEQSIGLQLGKLYLKNRQYQKALQLFEQLYQSNPRQNLEAQFYLATTQKIFGRYEEALEHFEVLRLRHRRIGDRSLNRSRMENEIAGCHMGLAARDTVVTTAVAPLPASINHSNMVYGPVLLSDGAFVYGSIRPNAPGETDLTEAYQSTRQFYRAEQQADSSWVGQLSPETPFVNTPEFDTGRGVFSIDKERFYATGCFIDHRGRRICHIYVSHLQNGEWSAPVALGPEVNHPRFTSAQPAVGTLFDSSMEVLYFVSDRPGGAGGMDIWFTVYNKRNNSYRKGENAGVFINTAGDEITPFFDLPSHRLYFSSNGWPGYGGMDVFYASGNMVTWEPAVNAGVPINSSFDDFDYIKNFSGQFGLLVSNRPGLQQQEAPVPADHLFAFREKQAPRVLLTGQLMREDRLEEQLLDRRPDRPMVGDSTRTAIMNQPVAIAMVKDSASALFLQEVSTNAEGRFEVWVDPNADYRLSLVDSTLLERSFSVSTKNMDQGSVLQMDTVALNTIPQRAIVIDNIYYEFDRAELTAEARSVLDSTLLQILERYPHVKVEIAAHTDDVGSPAYNKRLSEQRAASVVRHLAGKGISRSRLSAVGYGQERPLAPNKHPDGSDNPEGRQKNRRTEFTLRGMNQP